MNDINNIINDFPFSEKKNYNWKLFATKKNNENRKIDIYSGNNVNNSDDAIIVEAININQLNKNDYKQIIKKLMITLSLKIYEYFPHNISTFLSKNEEYVYFMIKENCASLNMLLNSKYNNYLDSNDLIKWIVYQVSFGLYILHSNNIIHHDIKPSNILIDFKGGVSIEGFDCSIFKGEDSYEFTLAYSPPELLIEHKVNEKIDMWQLGVLILELYNKKKSIFKNEKANNIKEQKEFLLSILGVKDNYSDEFLEKELSDNKNITFKIEEKLLEKIKDPEAKDLINRLITFSPDKRYTAKQVLESNYLEIYKGIDSFEIKKIEFPIDYKDLTENTLDKQKFIELIKKIVEK